jgi:hypothetical protein
MPTENIHNQNEILKIMDTPLFWSSRFHESHLGDFKLMKFYEESQVNQQNNHLILPYKITATNFISPGEATFGGLWVEANIIMTPSEFLPVFQKLKGLYGGFKFIWKFPPGHINNLNFNSQMETIRSNFAFSEVADVNQHINLADWAPTSMSYGNLKKLKQFYKAGGRVHEGDYSRLDESISVLEFSRVRRGLSLSMQRNHLTNSISRLNQDFRLYSAEIDGEVVGAAITVDIGFSTRYVLYWGDNDLGRKFSVTASVCDAIIKSAKSAGVTKLDLGVSSIDGILDAGLHRFKMNLGAVESLRKTLAF